MKKAVVILWAVLTFFSVVSAAPDQTKGVHLDGMYTDHILGTLYDAETKTHTLTVNTSGGYVDDPIFAQFMHIEGDSTVIDAIGNYSDAVTTFIIKPPAGTVFYITKMLVSYKDTGSFDTEDYGNGINLTNGLSFWYRIDGVNVSPAFEPPFYVTSNSDWATLCPDTRVDTYGSGNEQLNARFIFTQSGKFLKLDGNKGEEFVLYLNDDFTGLLSHKFLFKGYKVVE